MRLRGSAELLEDRRWRALKLLDEGLSLNEAGRRIGCAPSSVMHWRDMRRRGGTKALRVRSSPGRPPKLPLLACRLLLKLLLEGAMASGYPTQLWTTARIGEVIRRPDLRVFFGLTGFGFDDLERRELHQRLLYRI